MRSASLAVEEDEWQGRALDMEHRVRAIVDDGVAALEQRIDGRFSQQSQLRERLAEQREHAILQRLDDVLKAHAVAEKLRQDREQLVEQRLKRTVEENSRLLKEVAAMQMQLAETQAQRLAPIGEGEEAAELAVAE